MNHYFRTAQILLVCLVAMSCQANKWQKYYQNKLKEPPRELLVKALGLMNIDSSAHPRAIDLGAGVGNETLLLLKSRFLVTAVDNNALAIEMLRNRPGMQEHLRNLTTMESSIETLDWSKLPKSDLMLASFALPFVAPKNFSGVFNGIKNNLKPRGYFVGHFFDPSYIGFPEKERVHMSFQTKQQVFELFKDFEMLYFNEHESPGKSGTGRAIVSEALRVRRAQP